MQYACYILMNLVNGLARHESPCSSVVRASRRPVCGRKVMGSTPVGDSEFFSLSHARDKRNQNLEPQYDSAVIDSL